MSDEAEQVSGRPSIMAAGPLTMEEAEAVLSQSQSAPTPDYASGLQPDVERCSCDEAVALRGQLDAAEQHVKILQSNWDACHGQHRAALDRIDRALIILSEPGMWSDFAARARKGLAAHDLHVISAADKAVLEAGNLVLDSSLRRIAEENGGCLADWAKAELARREAHGG